MRSIADGGVGDLAELIALPRGRLRRLLRDHTSVPLLRTGPPGLMNLMMLCLPPSDRWPVWQHRVGAHRDLERQLDHRPAPPPAGVAGCHGAGRRVPPGDQDRRRRLPHRGRRGARLPGRLARRRPLERRRTAEQGRPRRRRARADRRARLPGPRGPRGRRDLRRRAALVGLRAQRPRARTRPLRLQARLAGRAGYDGHGGPHDVREARGDGRLQRGAHRRRRLGPRPPSKGRRT